MEEVRNRYQPEMRAKIANRELHSNNSGHNSEWALERDGHYEALDADYKRLTDEKRMLLERRGQY